MAFERSILIWCVALPVVIAAVAVLISRWLATRWLGTRWLGTRWLGGRRAALLAAVGWWLAIVVGMYGRQQWQWWPEEAWRQSIWPLLGWAVLVAGMSATSPMPSVDDRSEWRWVLAGLLAVLTAWVAMPAGEQWGDTFGLHRGWMVAVTSACLLNTFAVEQMARRGASRWCALVAVAAMGGPMALAASTYASLGEWALTVVAATSAAAIVGIFVAETRAWVVAIPAVAAAASVLAAARFYTYEDHPTWIYFLMLFLPSLVAVVDGLLARRGTWTRVGAAGLLSLTIVAVVVWWVMSGDM